MSVEQIIALIGIGASVGALTYYTFFKRTKAAEHREAESFEIPVAVPKAFGVKERLEPQPQKVKKGTPLKAVCTQCKNIATLPFRCRFCTELFCGEHRLPENHNCEAL